MPLPTSVDPSPVKVTAVPSVLLAGPTGTASGGERAPLSGKGCSEPLFPTPSVAWNRTSCRPSGTTVGPPYGASAAPSIATTRPATPLVRSEALSVRVGDVANQPPGPGAAGGGWAAGGGGG